MKARFVIVTAALALAAGSALSHAQTAAPPVPGSQQPAAATAGTAPAADDLSALEAMTFSCPKAGLNAAAREAAKVVSQGTYQFAYFKIISDAHHASYEVHFKSNYTGEPDLKYCVAMYCQQGWDPKTAKTEVTLMGDARHAGAAAHAGSCAVTPAPANRRLKR
jgi:hypothetical protein